MANVNAMIVSKLNQKRSGLVESLTKLDELIAEFGGKASSKTGAKRGPKVGSKRILSPEHIAKMQAARKAKKAPVNEGANLAAAAGE